jgi:hypothetical protein
LLGDWDLQGVFAINRETEQDTKQATVIVLCCAGVGYSNNPVVDFLLADIYRFFAAECLSEYVEPDPKVFEVSGRHAGSLLDRKKLVHDLLNRPVSGRRRRVPDIKAGAFPQRHTVRSNQLTAAWASILNSAESPKAESPSFFRFVRCCSAQPVASSLVAKKLPLPTVLSSGIDLPCVLLFCPTDKRPFVSVALLCHCASWQFSGSKVKVTLLRGGLLIRWLTPSLVRIQSCPRFSRSEKVMTCLLDENVFDHPRGSAVESAVKM